jgi:hypothetical protein
VLKPGEKLGIVGIRHANPTTPVRHLPTDNHRSGAAFLGLKGITLDDAIGFGVRDNLDRLKRLELWGGVGELGGDVGINADGMLGKITAIGPDHTIGGLGLCS